MSYASLPITETLPGAEAPRAELLARLREARAQKPSHYVPRTRHLRADGEARYTNRLIMESSPYLLQHAHNPVDWYPWGDEAFDTARRLHRPVLLSVGYATCHWCHVMEEESFEDEAIAAYLNAHYIAIKVDREERPDIDAIYMTAVQAITGHGGWPMTVWLTADRVPYYGGTYYPPRDGMRGARVGFPTVLREMARVHREEPEHMMAAATEIVTLLQERLKGEKPGELPDAGVLDRAFAFYNHTYDDEHGGLAHPPKFPATLPVRWLLRYSQRTGQARAKAMAIHTLQKMARGGIYDHIGGGFHRYAVDTEWRIPHFEKMLYDNALLVPAYLEGFQVSGDRGLANVAQETLDYLCREMTAPGGGFYAATDADSPNPERQGEREEGWYYSWTPTEIDRVLAVDAAVAIKAYYAVTEQGNFEGRNVLHAPHGLAEVARALEIDEPTLDATLKQARTALYEARRLRPEPLLDDKILTAWNALTVSALIKGALVLREPRYLAIARHTIDFILTELMAGGRLRRLYKDGEARGPAFLDDYAFMIQALLDLYEATFELEYLKQALALEQVTATYFYDAKHGGYYTSASDHEVIIVREKPAQDSAIPSGNSVMATNLLRLAELTQDATLRDRADATLKAFHHTLTKAPAALSEMLNAVEFALAAPLSIVLVSANGLDDTAPLLAELHRHFVPNRIVAATGSKSRGEAHALIPLLRDRESTQGQATAYVCRGQSCSLPVHDPQSFARQLEA